MFNCLFFAPVQVMKVLSWTQIAGQYIPLVQFSPFMANGQVYHNVNVAFYSIMYMSAFSSILTFFAIAVERCKAIFYPIQHLQNVHAWRIFGAIWFISFCIPLPYLFFLFVLQQTKSSFVYDFAVVLVLLFLFLSVSLMFLAAFLKALYKLRHQPSTTDDGNQQFKLTRMAMIMYSTCTMSWLHSATNT